jgi:hypothetical protein
MSNESIDTQNCPMSDEELRRTLATLLLTVQRDVNSADEYVSFAIDEIKSRDQQIALAARIDERKIVGKDFDFVLQLHSKNPDLSPIASLKTLNKDRLATLKQPQEVA